MKKFVLTKTSLEKANSGFKQYRKVIETAKSKGLNESDTSNIINDILGEVLGYDKFFDVTTEYKIRGQYCDYGVKINDKLTFLIEVKAITIDLNNNHIFQATSYAGNEGIEWVILTNLKEWRLYHLSFGKKVDYDLVLQIDLLSDESNAKLLDKFKYFHKESFSKKIVDDLYIESKASSRENIIKVIKSEPLIRKIQSELKNLTGVKITTEEVEKRLNKILKSI